VTAPVATAPHVIAVAPAARSTRADYGSTIWAQFDEALDPSSVTTHNVYLKLDTVRLPIAVAWDSTTRRVEILQSNPLALLTTYTVELSPNLRAADGTPLGVDYVWQFTTTSVRHPVPVLPADRGWDSPFTPLIWAGNETTPGPLFYELYTGPDSAAVADRAVPYLWTGTSTSYLPGSRWPEHAPLYWSITVINVNVGERSNGPTWRFDTPYADAPMDSISVPASDWGYQKTSGFFSVADCFNGTITTGSIYTSYCQWTVAAAAATPVMAALHWDCSAATGYQDSLAGSAWLGASTAALSCGSSVPRREDTSRGRLATGWQVGPRTMRFDSDTLALFVEAMLRRGGLYGFYMHSGKTMKFVAPQGSDPTYDAVFEFTYYLGPGTPAPARPAAVAPTRRPGAARRFPLDPGRGSPFNSRR
jgi:hypothetical protein